MDFRSQTAREKSFVCSNDPGITRTGNLKQTPGSDM